MNSKQRLRDFFKKEDLEKFFNAVDNFDIHLTSKQSTWAENIQERFEQYGISAYCNDQDKSFLTNMLEKMDQEADDDVFLK